MISRATRLASPAFQLALLAIACVYMAFLASDGYVGLQILGLLLLAAIGVALVLPPHVFVALALCVFGSYTLSRAHPLGFGGTSVYSTDILLLIVLLRAALPRERVPAPGRLDTIARACFGLWALVMILAGIRSLVDGTDPVSVIRLEVPLIYSVGFFLGLGRIMRERTFRFDKAVRNLLIVGLGFVGWMALMRALNQPFETGETVGRLGEVITTSGVFRRDYGFESAFILYPALAIAGAAYLLYNPRRMVLAAVVAGVGTLATLLTLIRGEIFGLFVGLAVMVVLRNKSALQRIGRVRGIVAAMATFAVAALGLWALDAPVARSVLERSLPGVVQQSETGASTAAYRLEAIDAGFAVAKREPIGVGLIPSEELAGGREIEPGHLAHSGITTMLVYAGWIGLAASALALLGLLRASFRAPQPVPWLHPFFVGALVMLAVYTVAAAGLVGQPWVTGPAALIAALRFQGARARS